MFHKAKGDRFSLTFNFCLLFFSINFKVKWFAQQERRKKSLYDQQIAVTFNDPRWDDQEWYLVSTKRIQTNPIKPCCVYSN